jgi:hypothetical protein
MGLMDDAVIRARCRFSGDLVIYRKVMQTLDGVIPDISPACRADRVLTAALMRQLTGEWAERAIALPSDARRIAPGRRKLPTRETLRLSLDL